MQRENRYIVIKEADAKNILGPLNYKLLHTIADSIERGRSIKGKAPLECVVVESDWPEYEPVWNMIAARVDDHNASNGVTAVPGGPNSAVLRDYARYQFLRDKDAFGADNEPGLAGWEELADLDGDEFDAAIDARMAHPDIAYTVPQAEVIAPRSAVLERNPNRLASLVCDEDHLKNLMMLWSENTLIHHLAARLLAVMEASKPVLPAPAPEVEPDISSLADSIVRELVDCDAVGDGVIARSRVFVYNACRSALLGGKLDGK
jgi:hypothetical protein